MPNFRRYLLSGTAYFVTTNVEERKPLFKSRALALIVTENLEWYRKSLEFQLLSYVVMPDHLHLILIPSEKASLSEIMRRFKSFTGRAIAESLGISGGVWQSRYYDRAIRSQSDLLTALDYIHNNPVVAKLVDTPDAYEFSSFSCYYGGVLGPLAVDMV